MTLVWDSHWPETMNWRAVISRHSRPALQVLQCTRSKMHTQHLWRRPSPTTTHSIHGDDWHTCVRNDVSAQYKVAIPLQAEIEFWMPRTSEVTLMCNFEGQSKQGPLACSAQFRIRWDMTQDRTTDQTINKAAAHTTLNDSNSQPATLY